VNAGENERNCDDLCHIIQKHAFEFMQTVRSPAIPSPDDARLWLYGINQNQKNSK
jgi:hypothetical protein